jgi:hypothetical protein
MSKRYLISDMSFEECPTGGAEVGDKLLREKFDLTYLKSSELDDLDPDATYVISNISQLKPNVLEKLKTCNYIIHECDFKITPYRQGGIMPDGTVPFEHRCNYDLYKNAKAVFVKTEDHKRVFEKNGVTGNFINISTNLWSEEDLETLSKLRSKHIEKKDQYCVYLTDNWTKNSLGAIKYLVDKGEVPGYIQASKSRESFLEDMAQFKGMVFFPAARESYCRIIVEAKCLDLTVVTSSTGYGVTGEDYFHELAGEQLIEHLREGTSKALDKFEEYLA